MKIYLRLEGKANMSMNVEDSKAFEVYGELAAMLFELATGESMPGETAKEDSEPLPMALTEKNMYPGGKPFLEVAKEEAAATVVAEPKPEPTPQRVQEPKKAHAPQKPQLIFFRCEDCGRVQFKFTSEGETVECFDCAASVEIEQARPAAYECPNCGMKSGFHVTDDVQTIPCKGCGGPIDLAWHEKKQRFVSANLL